MQMFVIVSPINAIWTRLFVAKIIAVRMKKSGALAERQNSDATNVKARVSMQYEYKKKKELKYFLLLYLLNVGVWEKLSKIATTAARNPSMVNA